MKFYQFCMFALFFDNFGNIIDVLYTTFYQQRLFLFLAEHLDVISVI